MTGPVGRRTIKRCGNLDTKFRKWTCNVLPACGSTKLRIGVVFSGEIACEFRHGAVVEILENSVLDSAWDDESECRCVECRWSGRVEEVRDSAQSRSVATAAKTSGSAAMERDLLDGKCPSGLEQPVRGVLDAVRLLKTQLQILETVERAHKKRGRGINSSDTAIL